MACSMRCVTCDGNQQSAVERTKLHASADKDRQAKAARRMQALAPTLTQARLSHSRPPTAAVRPPSAVHPLPAVHPPPAKALPATPVMPNCRLPGIARYAQPAERHSVMLLNADDAQALAHTCSERPLKRARRM